METKNLPHLIFYGPPGTGKTSTILACARELFGDQYRNRVMELNASDERGIGVVRNKIKNFAQVAVSSQQNGSIPPYKLIVLDEADSMTTDAQSALRRTMETYSKVTRFCIICNYITRLIPPIASRCAKFRFKPLPEEAMVSRLQHICAEESVSCPKEVLAELMTQSEGDMRRAIQMLQSVHRLYGEDMAPQAVLDICGALPKQRITEIFTTCQSNNFESLQTLCDDLLAEGFPVSQIAQQMLETLLGDELALGNMQKSKMALQIAELEKQLVEGGSDMLQLMNLLAFCMRQMCGPKA
jgi:replication factor C subunit 2/4